MKKHNDLRAELIGLIDDCADQKENPEKDEALIEQEKRDEEEKLRPGVDTFLNDIFG